jgi:hypothetical protein
LASGRNLKAVGTDGQAELIVECLWPDVKAADVEKLNWRIQRECGRSDQIVRYLGSVLITEDEVVLCMFKGSQEAVRVVAQAAQVPFGRVLAAQSTEGQRLWQNPAPSRAGEEPGGARAG